MADASASVQDNRDESRYQAEVDGALSILEYRRDGDTITFTHTDVPASLEGRGVGSTLARFALDRARTSGLRVVPQCPFVRAYIERHEEYRDLVAE